MRALVLSGGGSKGAFQAGVLKSLVDRGFTWDVIAGVSVGALNGAFIAQFPKEEQAEGVRKLVEFWKEIEGDKSIFRRWFPFGKLHALWKGSMYDTSPITKKVKATLDAEALKTSGVKLIVGAVCLESGEYRAIQGSEPDIHEWVLASAAFPVAFPPRKIDGKSWVDGGVRDITPITDVLDMGASEIDVVLTGPLNEPEVIFPSKDASNAIPLAIRVANIMADEIFNSDLDRVPEKDMPRVQVFAPPNGADLAEPLSFDPKKIASMYELGLQVGMKEK